MFGFGDESKGAMLFERLQYINGLFLDHLHGVKVHDEKFLLLIYFYNSLV